MKERFAELVQRERDTLRERFGVQRIGLFGSAARGEENPDSDVDILVEFDEMTFERYMDLKFFFEDTLGRRVDLVPADSIKPRLREPILREVQYAEER
ncbi:MAG: nucleotidyltransferase family protein [Planctomycetes bacterium]|nr:nucleotidyltransferase family protein [Planctomycetota bacterium]